MGDLKGTPKNLKNAIEQGFDRYMEDENAHGKEAALKMIGESVMEFLNNRLGALSLSLEMIEMGVGSEQKRTMKMLDQLIKDVKI